MAIVYLEEFGAEIIDNGFNKEKEFLIGTKPSGGSDTKENASVIGYEISIVQNNNTVIEFFLGKKVKEDSGCSIKQEKLAEILSEIITELAHFAEKYLEDSYSIPLSIYVPSNSECYELVLKLKSSLN